MLIIGLVLMLLPIILTILRKVTPLYGIYISLAGIFMGAWMLHDFYSMSINNPDRSMMYHNKNLILLLEQGRTIEGKVLERWYDKWRPAGWMIFYSFEVPNPKEGKLEIYYGSAKGPKHYYASLPKGDTITIIYYPAEPKINSEIYEFLSDPHYLSAFKQTGKLELYDKFRDKYKDKFENHSLFQWYKESSRK
jgi:hypothetical protein